MLLLITIQIRRFRSNTRLIETLRLNTDYGAVAERDLEDLTEKQILEKLQELNLIGQQAIKANQFAWQSSVPDDEASVAFEDIPVEYR